jgi:hypothetical protein
VIGFIPRVYRKGCLVVMPFIKVEVTSEPTFDWTK